MSAVRNRASLFDLAQQLGRLTQTGSTKPKPAPWIKPPCLICDAPNPPYGVAVTDEAGCTREDWFCPAHVPPGFFTARDQSTVAAAGRLMNGPQVRSAKYHGRRHEPPSAKG